LLTDAIKSGKMPPLKYLDELRTGQLVEGFTEQEKIECKQAFFFFAEHLLECVAGKRQWKKQKYQAELSKCVSVSDEAFCLLLLHNSLDSFEELATKEDGVKCVVKPKYTGQRGSNKRFEGWKKEGLLKYNEICGNVKQDRVCEVGKDMEQEFLDYMKAKKNQGRKKRKIYLDGEQEEEQVPMKLYNDFDNATPYSGDEPMEDDWDGFGDEDEDGYDSSDGNDNMENFVGV
jgi:hypothetical protein